MVWTVQWNRRHWKKGFDDESARDPELSHAEGKRYRAVVARGVYLSADRLDMQCAANSACRQLAKPRQSEEGRMQRIARYLKKYPTKLIRHAWTLW